MRKLTVFTILTAAFLTGIIIERSQAQTTKSPMTKAQLKFAVTPKWYVNYLVLIKGTGGEALKVVRGGQTITWTINRRYSGSFELSQKSFKSQPTAQVAEAMKNIKLPPGVTLPPEAKQALENVAEIDSIWWSNEINDYQRIAQAEINDERVSVFVDEGGEAGVGKCRESKTENWTFNNQITTGNASTFTIKPEKDMAAVGFSFAPGESVGAVPVKFSTQVEGNCSKDANEKKNSSKNVKVSDIRIPSVKELLNGGGVRLSLPKGTVNYEADSWQYTSPMIPIDEQLGGFPDSKGNVGVMVYFKFSKTPPLASAQ